MTGQLLRSVDDHFSRLLLDPDPVLDSALEANRAGALPSIDGSPQGAWLWARPGQILQYGPELTEAHGTVVLFQPGFLSTSTAEATRTDQLAAGQPLIPRAEYERHDRRSDGRRRSAPDFPVLLIARVV